MNFFRRRKLIKHAHDVLRHAGHIRNMREDLMSEADLMALDEGRETLNGAVHARDLSAIEKAEDRLCEVIARIVPAMPHIGLRENLEVIIVAVSVAMAVRTYFIQPFKIPTGSMQPTLWGITSHYQPEPTFLDRVPMKYGKWLLTGDWYRSVKVTSGGVLTDIKMSRNDPASYHYFIGKKHYRVPVDAVRGARREVRFVPGDYIPAGTVLWSGIATAGDHVFVDKVRWNIWKPKRDQIMVFGTDAITMKPAVPLGTHYIKRMVGLPGDQLSIDPPYVKIDGEPVVDKPGMLRVVNGVGYRTIRNQGDVTSHTPLRTPDSVFPLSATEYFALGDNQASSKDGRYWGAVPEQSLVGPAFMVYWPFVRSGRWQFGLAN